MNAHIERSTADGRPIIVLTFSDFDLDEDYPDGRIATDIELWADAATCATWHAEAFPVDGPCGGYVGTIHA